MVYSGGPCVECGVTMRSKRKTAAQAPGTRRHYAGGLCAICKERRVRLERGGLRKRLEREAEYRRYIIGEAEFLVGTDNSDSLAQRLGYADYDNLARSLDRWGESELVRRLERHRIRPYEVEEFAA